MSDEEVVALCTSLPGALAEDTFRDGETVVFKHRENGKWFGVLINRGGERLLNLKCDPVLAQLLRENVPGVTPGYHMNKTHWNSLRVRALAEDEIEREVRHSYELTRPGRRKK